MVQHKSQATLPERYGPASLLVLGVASSLAAIGSAFTGHELATGGLAAFGLLAIVLSIVVTRMEGDFSLLLLKGRLRSSESPALREHERSIGQVIDPFVGSGTAAKTPPVIDRSDVTESARTVEEQARSDSDTSRPITA